MTPTSESNHSPEAGVIGRRLTTPRAAAVAGILFALLYGSALVLLHTSIPSDIAAGDDWLQTGSRSVSLALALVPFAGIAFLWYMAVLRDRIGEHEDQFFVTVFLGSGWLYLAMTFAGAAVVGGLIASYEFRMILNNGDIYDFARTVTYQLINIYAIRMAGVFMISTATIWVRTRVMPRLLALLTYLIALVLLLTINLTVWMTLLFPTWVLVVSILFLIANYRRRTPGA